LLPALLLIGMVLFSCANLEEKTILLNPGDEKQRVLDIMGTPRDRQFRGTAEAWQYCQTGAGFGYHDYRVVWFRNGLVTGITSYKDYTPASSCAGHLREVRWEDAPDYTLEIRNR
jgi:hypothetical protein